jgi:hypothetical protein
MSAADMPRYEPVWSRASRRLAFETELPTKRLSGPREKPALKVLVGGVTLRSR